MRSFILLCFLLAASLAQDDTAGSSTTVDNAQHGPGNPDSAEKLMNSESTADVNEDEGMGKLIRPGGDQAVEAKNETVATKKPMACLCKGVDKMPEDSKVLSAGWKKRAKKCGTQQEEQQQADPEKCEPTGKVRCADKEELKKGSQCASKPKTRRQKEAAAAKKEAKAKEKAGKEDAAEMGAKSKCLSKYCNDDDNLNRPKKGTIPVTSIQCYDKCNKNHCIKLFDQGWEHWYECVQTCVGSCFRFEG